MVNRGFAIRFQARGYFYPMGAFFVNAKMAIIVEELDCDERLGWITGACILPHFCLMESDQNLTNCITSLAHRLLIKCLRKKV